MNIYEEVKSTLKDRQNELIKINKGIDVLTSLTRTLLDSLSTLLRNTEQPLSYDDKKELKSETERLIKGINNELEIQNRMMEDEEVVEL
tara:strand:- start:286 stop:552 length:267 start_codon:yes stop_codon:yes gene_type:complete